MDSATPPLIMCVCVLFVCVCCFVCRSASLCSSSNHTKPAPHCAVCLVALRLVLLTPIIPSQRHMHMNHYIACHTLSHSLSHGSHEARTCANADRARRRVRHHGDAPAPHRAGHTQRAGGHAGRPISRRTHGHHAHTYTQTRHDMRRRASARRPCCPCVVVRSVCGHPFMHGANPICAKIACTRNAQKMKGSRAVPTSFVRLSTV